MAEVVVLLRLFLEELMAGAARRTKRVAKNRAILPAAWTQDRLKSWADAQDLVADAVTLYHPRPGCQVVMFRISSGRQQCVLQLSPKPSPDPVMECAIRAID